MARGQVQYQLICRDQEQKSPSSVNLVLGFNNYCKWLGKITHEDTYIQTKAVYYWLSLQKYDLYF